MTVSVLFQVVTSIMTVSVLFQVVKTVSVLFQVVNKHNSSIMHSVVLSS